MKNPELHVGKAVFTLRLVPTLMTAVMFAVLIALGCWQLHRAEWKGTLIAQWEAQKDLPAIEDLPPADKSAEAVYRKVKFMGKFLHDKSVQLGPRAAGGMKGYELITPFRYITGEIILVNRGFVAEESHSAIDQPIGTIFVEGMLEAFPKRGAMQPDNKPEEGQWFWLDPGAVTAAQQLSTSYPLQLVAEGQPVNNMWPRPRPPAPPYTNNHLTYAFIWFSLALALLVIYVFSQSRTDRE
jgi:surfeit locus 1 family protein